MVCTSDSSALFLVMSDAATLQEFDGFTIQNQAYRKQFLGFYRLNKECLIVEIPPDQSNPVNTGLIGLGPSFGSNIEQLLGSPSGRTPLDKSASKFPARTRFPNEKKCSIFNQNKSTPNFISVLLGRSDDPDMPFPGEITVSTIVPGFEAVSSQTKLPVSIVSTSEQGNQHCKLVLSKPVGQWNSIFSIQGKHY